MEIEHSDRSLDAIPKRGRSLGSSNLNSNQHTSISITFRRVGLDWRENLAQAILKNDQKRINLWLKLLPYLVSKNKKNVKKSKASKAALNALAELERE